MNTTIERLEQERDSVAEVLTCWADLAAREEERGENEQAQVLTNRGADLALFRMLLHECTVSIYLVEPLPHLRTLFHIADTCELEHARDAGLAKQARDCIFALMSGLQARDSDRIVDALCDILMATEAVDAELGAVRQEYEKIKE
ncbi:hypothetical protein [Paenibacillus vini]|uniref:Uncharacterized protein n=1 Tax=Paenibacillus vini TaxID=1476024 RepID=A0ABQ4MH33_9BACL|nr:hypothetical protein [Paenibacillus vini]GIP55267.1 hypothetical protein J42TS3_43020 [Paenibacillus vini]